MHILRVFLTAIFVPEHSTQSPTGFLYLHKGKIQKLLPISSQVWQASSGNTHITHTTSTMPPKGRGATFTALELSSFLDLLEERLPISLDEWDMVTALHLATFPEPNRNKDTLKRKFQMLYSTKMPTGDPNIPPNVLRAKRINNEIKEKTELVEDGDDDDDDVGYGYEGVDTEGENIGIVNIGTIVNRSIQEVSMLNVPQPIVHATPILDAAPHQHHHHPITAQILHELPPPPHNVVQQPTNEVVPPPTEGRGTAPAEGRGTATPSVSNSIRKNSTFSVPLQRMGVKRPGQHDNMDQYFNYMILQRQMDREEQRERWEMERRQDEIRRREDERREQVRREEERQRSLEDRERQFNLMQVILLGNRMPMQSPSSVPSNVPYSPVNSNSPSSPSVIPQNQKNSAPTIQHDNDSEDEKDLSN